MMRELSDGTIVEVSAAEEAEMLAAESVSAEADRKRMIAAMAKDRVLAHIADDEDQSEMIVRLLLALTDIGQRLVANGTLTTAELSGVTKTLNSKAEAVVGVRSAVQSAISGSTSVDEFETILDGLIPSPVI